MEKAGSALEKNLTIMLSVKFFRSASRPHFTQRVPDESMFVTLTKAEPMFKTNRLVESKLRAFNNNLDSLGDYMA